MTIQSQTNKISYTGNGATTTFAYNFLVSANTWLNVYVNSVLQTLTTDYSVTGVGVGSGGNVVFVSAPANAATIVIARTNIPQTQLTDYTPNDPFPAETHEAALDKLTMLIQQANESNNRSIKFPAQESNSSLLAVVATRKNTVLAFNSAGDLSYETLPEGSPGDVFLQAGSGAVERTFQNKVRETKTPQDFGAVGDGITNDTAAIQAALNASYRVRIPPGTYSCGTLTIPAGTEIYGDGDSSIIVQDIAPSNGQGLLYVNSGSSSAQVANIRIHRLQIKGTVSTDGFSEFKHLISLNGVKNVTISNCLITGFRGDGIYIGSGDTGGQERHNNAVKIINNYIDGENNDNRNGISVIDGDNVTISGNTFIRCTRTNMPGAIDFEPDSSAYHVIKNCKVINNSFSEILGNVAIVTIDLRSTTFTAQPHNFVFSGNTFDNLTRPAFFYGGNSGNSGKVNLVISNNTGKCSRAFSFLGYVDGITYAGNTFDVLTSALAGFTVADSIYNLNIINNILSGPGGIDAVTFKNGANFKMIGNVFSGFTNALAIGVSAATITNVDVSHNTFNSVTSAVTNSGGVDLSTCRYIHNSPCYHNFGAYINDDCGSIVNSNTVFSFNSTTLPDSFPIGISTAVINGDTGVPNGGGSHQGVLVTHRMTSASGYEKWTHQVFYAASNTLKDGAFWTRKRDDTTNTWLSFYEHTGV